MFGQWATACTANIAVVVTGTVSAVARRAGWTTIHNVMDGCACMYREDMQAQEAVPREALLAPDVWTLDVVAIVLTCVNTFMTFEIAALCEASPARRVLALVGLLACVCSVVSLQSRRLREILFTANPRTVSTVTMTGLPTTTTCTGIATGQERSSLE